ncbi:MAG: VWA domain-containing protein [Chitinophagaceae bacterium]|nr:VWA domain-containing protein [Chitinophagaceae bacterium]
MIPRIWILCCCLPFSLSAQYLLRGEVRNDMRTPLEGVTLRISSNPQLVYQTGAGGIFSIPMNRESDTLCVLLDGYEPLKKFIRASGYEQIVLKMLPATARRYRQKLSSVTTNMSGSITYPTPASGESYSNLIENKFIAAKEFPETGFSLNIDKAAYSNIRRFLNNGMLVTPDAVRIEEMLNYFGFPLPAASAAQNGFRFHPVVTSCPWNSNLKLMFLHLAAPSLKLDQVPPSNLVFLVDVSGSMDQPNRLPLLQSAFKMLTDNLRVQDSITIVTYGGGVHIALPRTSGADKKQIYGAIDSLIAGGDTPGAGAIITAYEMARQGFIPGGNNRVILATDGDFNVGQSSEKELEDLIIRYKQTGIYLTCLGVGMGNYKDSKLEILSKKGNGNFAYIDQIREAEKTLVKEFTQTLYAVADDVSLSVRFNPESVSEYRLIGFDNKKNAVEDSSSLLEGGEIGSGHTSLAVFELNLKHPNDSLTPQHWADISLHYREPVTEQKNTIQFKATTVIEPWRRIDQSYRFAAAVAMFGSVLRHSAYTSDFKLEDVSILVKSVIQPGNILQQELLTLVQKAIQLYHPSKRRRK